MQKTIEVVYEKGVFKPLERVDFGEGEKVVISIETEKKEIREIKIPLREYNDFLPRDFTFTLEKLRTDSRERFKRLGIIP
jgi:predicted DNA-binding antitoxin AbrB/MazE fold protein